MRVSVMLHAIILLFATQYVAAEVTESDSTSVEDILSVSSIVSLDSIHNGCGTADFAFAGFDIDDLAVTSTAISTSTLGSGLNIVDTSGTEPAIISTETTNVLSIPTASHEYDLKQRDDDPDDPLPSDSLPPLPGYGAELTKYLQGIQERLNEEKKWLNHEQADTFGKWYLFTQKKTAAGVKGLYGCTSVIIVSTQGVYASHIYENPVFVQKSKFGTERPTPEDYFRKASFDALINGDPDSDSKPIKDLIGTKEDPGALHYTHNPKIYLISPYKNGGIGPMMYANRIQWLSEQLHKYLCPPESSGQSHKPTALPYKIASKKVADEPTAIPGKAIMEFTPIDRYEQDGDQLTAKARWRLWVNGKEAAVCDYPNEEIIFPAQCAHHD